MMPQHLYTLYVVGFSIYSKVTSSYCIATHKHKYFCSSCCLGVCTPPITPHMQLVVSSLALLHTAIYPGTCKCKCNCPIHFSYKLSHSLNHSCLSIIPLFSALHCFMCRKSHTYRNNDLSASVRAPPFDTTIFISEC